MNTTSRQMVTRAHFRILLLTLIWMAAQPEAMATQVTPTNSQLNLLPWPKSVSIVSGEVHLVAQSRIVAANLELQPLAEVLREEFRLLAGLDLKTAAGSPRSGDLLLSINKELKAGEDILMIKNREVVRTREGAYRLGAKDLVAIEGFDYRAVAEGTATLLQAITRTEKGVVLPAMTITDWPHADYTGTMLDVARQANTIEDIRSCIQVCRAYKVRYLQLHMTNDQAWTFPSTAYPKLGTMNGSAHDGPVPQRYDRAELKALVKYADERGVTLVPELETPGHSSSACGTMPGVFGYVDPATKQPVAKGMMNIAHPKLYEAIDTIVGEMCDVFTSSPYFHIGFDEVSGLGNVASTPEAQAFMKEKNLKDAGELLTYFAVQVNEMVKKRGKKTIIWEGAANGASKDMIHMTWDGNARTAERLVAQGITTITVPWNLAGVPWHEWTMYHCNGSVLKKGDSVLGAMLPVWEQKGEVHLRWLRRGVPNRQERTWGPDTVIDTTNFTHRLEATDMVLDRLMHGFAVWQSTKAEEGMLQRQVTAPIMLSLRAWPSLGEVRFTTDGSEPTAQSKTYSAPIRIGDNFTIKARLFDASGNPVAPAWVQPYTFAPLTLQPQGLLTNSTWFADSVTLTIACTMKDGTARYTLDGSAPLATSAAFTKPLVLTDTAVVNARWFDADNVGRGNVATATYRKLPTVKHAAVNKPVTITVTAKLDDPKAAAKLLVDGVLSRDGDWSSPEVLRLGDSDLEAVIDLGENTRIGNVIARFIYHQEAGIYPARRVDVFVSDDGRAFKAAGTTTFEVPQDRAAGGIFIQEIAVGSAAAGRYVKVFCKNNGLLPAWHQAPRVLGHMMLDEILVNPANTKK